MVYHRKSPKVERRELSILLFVATRTVDRRLTGRDTIIAFYGNDSTTAQALDYLCGTQLECRKGQAELYLTEAGIARLHRQMNDTHYILPATSDFKMTVA